MRALISTRALISAGAIALLALLIIMATAIVRATYVAPEQRLTNSARALVQRAFAADPAAMDELFDLSIVGTRLLLTQESARLAMGSAPSYEVTSARLTNESTFAVRGTLHTASGPLPLAVTYGRSTKDDPWVLHKLHPPRLLVTAAFPGDGAASINDVAVGRRALATTTFATWPGRALVSADGYDSQEVKLLAALTPDSSPDVTTVSLSSPSDRIDDAGLAAALEKELRSCLGPADLARVECAFVPPDPPAGSTSVRGVRYSDLRLGARQGIDTVGGLGRSGVQMGTVLVTGQWRLATGWRDFSTRTSFAYDYVATAGAGGVTVGPAPDRGDARYEVNRAWSRALSDRGSADVDE